MKSIGTRKNLMTASLVVVSLLPLAALSCRSGPPRGRGAEVRVTPPPPLAGSDVLLDGGVEVEARVAMAGMPGPGGPGGRRPPGGAGVPAGGPPMGGPPGGGPPMGGPPPSMGSGGGQAGGAAAMGGRGPSHALFVTFINTGSDAVEFTVVDVKSRLGNFLPQPDTLVLAPGQTGALYPMRGSLPDDAADLELTVTIRTKDGRSDTCVVMLKAEAAADAVGGA